MRDIHNERYSTVEISDEMLEIIQELVEDGEEVLA